MPSSGKKLPEARATLRSGGTVPLSISEMSVSNLRKLNGPVAVDARCFGGDGVSAREGTYGADGGW